MTTPKKSKAKAISKKTSAAKSNPVSNDVLEIAKLLKPSLRADFIKFMEARSKNGKDTSVTLDELATLRKKAKTNPTATVASPPRNLEEVWKIWTGSQPGQILSIPVESRGNCPAEVVMLGKLEHLITSKGTVKTFASGPFVVTDDEMERIWLVDVETQHFDLDLSGGLISYLAKKTKFGDRSAVSYVHRFGRGVRARMAGQIGEITGKFRLSGNGIEG